MTLTFPRAMPTEGADDQQFDLQRMDFATANGEGQLASVAAGPPLWKLALTLGEMSREDADAWRAFLLSLRGSARTFYARDLLRPWPMAYPDGFGGLTRHGGGAFPSTGAPTSWSLNGTRDVITLNGMPSTFAFKTGDWVGFVWDTDKRTAAKVLEAATAAAGVVSIAVEPPIPLAVPSDATINLAGVEIVMRQVPDSSQVGKETTLSTAGGTITAVQDLRE